MYVHKPWQSFLTDHLGMCPSLFISLVYGLSLPVGPVDVVTCDGQSIGMKDWSHQDLTIVAIQVWTFNHLSRKILVYIIVILEAVDTVYSY